MQKSEQYETQMKEIATIHQAVIKDIRSGIFSGNDLRDAGHIPGRVRGRFGLLPEESDRPGLCGKGSVAAACEQESLAKALSDMCGLWEHMCQNIGRPVVASVEYVQAKELLRKYEEKQARKKEETKRGKGKRNLCGA